MKFASSGVLWIALAVGMTATGAWSQPLTDRLPASTLVYVGWTPTAAMQNTMMAKMLADERITGSVRRLVQEMILSGRGGAGEGDKITDNLPALLETASHCEGCFAVLELSSGKKRLQSQSVLMVDLGAKRAAFEKSFAPIQNRLRERLGERLQMLKLERSWVNYTVDREGKPAVTWGIVGDTFIMYFGAGSREFVPRLVKGEIAPNLRTSPAFVDCVGKIEGDSIFTTYVDIRAALGLVRRVMEREGGMDLQFIVRNWDRLLNELGADNIKGLAEKTVIQDNQFVTRSLLRTEGAPRGLLPLLVQPAVDPAMMKSIPADAMVAAAMRMDLAQFYDRIKAAAVNIAGEPAKAAFNEIEQAALGMNLPIKDITAGLGDQWVYYNASSTGGFLLTGWTLVGTVRDPQKFNRALAAVRTIAGKSSPIRELRVDDVRIEYVRGRGFDGPFAPAWAVVGDKFVFSMFPQITEDAVRQIVAGQKSLLDNPDYVAARQRTGDTGPMLYISGPESIRNVYGIGLIFVTLVDSFGRYSDDGATRPSAVELLPSMQRILQYVGHSAVSIKPTADGILKTRSTGNPLLSPLTWVGTPAVWLAVGIPAIGQASEQELRVRSANNLRQVGMAAVMYANDNKGALPPDLDALKKSQDLGNEVMSSPFGPAKEGPDIVYLAYPGKKINEAGAEVIIAYDKAALESENGTNAVFADGHVEWLAPEDLKRMIEASKRKMAGEK